MAEEKVEEVKVESTETAETKVEVKSEKVEVKSEEKPAVKKKPLKKGGKRPNKRGGKGKPAAAKKPAVFSDSLEERFPNLAAKLKKKLEDGLKQKIKEAQKDPKVVEASKKFAQK